MRLSGVWRPVSLLALGFLALGCTQREADPDPTGKPPPKPPATEADRLACNADADCTLSGRVFTGRDKCCVTPCGIQAVNADVLEQFAASCEGTFSMADCPREHCAPPPPTRARCIDNECTVVQGPVVMTTCDADDDCTLADIDFMGASLCCASCPERSVNRESLDELRAWCLEQPADEPCAEAECMARQRVAACVDGQCVARDDAGG